MTSLSKRQPSAVGDGAVQYPDHLLDRVVARVAPFFTDGVTTTQTESLTLARQCIGEYRAVTGKELQLAGQIAALGMAVLTCLSASSEPGLPIETMLQMSENAIKLSNMSIKSTKMLEARQQERQRGQALSPETTQLDEAEFNAAIGKARDFVAYARTKVEALRVGAELGAAPATVGQPSSDAGAAEPALKLPPLIAEEMTPAVLNRRKNEARGWSKDFSKLSSGQGVTRH